MILNDIIEANIKRLYLLPDSIKPPPAERILRNLPWLSSDPNVMEHIKVCLVLCLLSAYISFLFLWRGSCLLKC